VADVGTNVSVERRSDMKSIVACIAIAVLVPVVGLAQEEITGTYYSFEGEDTTIELLDGRSLIQGTYQGFLVTDDPDSVFNRVKGRCLSEGVASASGETLEAAGACVLRNGDGDSFWYWWRRTEEGTAACPNACGIWGVLNGTGVFAGVTGSGTWKGTSLYPDGSDSGVWKLKVTRQ
jgi:hypothetical protein